MAGRNWLLIAGIALPGVVLLVFFAYVQLARQAVAPPAYDLLYAHFDYRQPGSVTVQLNFSVNDGRLEVRAHALRSPAAYRQQLYRWHHESGTSEPLTVEVPAELTETPRLVAVPALAGLRLSSGLEAPDGYSFDTGADRGPGLIGALFNQRRRVGSIHKLGVAHSIRPPEGAQRYWTPQFLGWILADE